MTFAQTEDPLLLSSDPKINQCDPDTVSTWPLTFKKPLPGDFQETSDKRLQRAIHANLVQLFPGDTHLHILSIRQYKQCVVNGATSEASPNAMFFSLSTSRTYTCMVHVFRPELPRLVIGLPHHLACIRHFFEVDVQVIFDPFPQPPFASCICHEPWSVEKKLPCQFNHAVESARFSTRKDVTFPLALVDWLKDYRTVFPNSKFEYFHPSGKKLSPCKCTTSLTTIGWSHTVELLFKERMWLVPISSTFDGLLKESF